MDILQRLENERKTLLARLAEIEAVLNDHQAWQRKVARVLGVAVQDIDDFGIHSASKTGVGSPDLGAPIRKKRDTVRHFENVVRDILTKAKTPLDRTRLLEEVVAAGVEVGGKDPLNTLGARLTRMSDVGNLRGQGYYLRSREAEFAYPSSLRITDVEDLLA